MKTALNNNTCTLCYPLCLQRNNHISSHPKSVDTNKSCLRTALLLWFYFGCLFLNVYKDLHFHFLNVLKATVTGMLSWVSITSIALLHLPFLSVLCLWEGTNSDLQASEVLVQWWSGWQAITGIKQTRQSRTIADRERTENVTTGSHRGTFSIVKYNHPLFYMQTQGKFPWDFIYMKLGKFSNFSDSLLCFWG